MSDNDAELENCVKSGENPALAECVLIYLFGQSGHFFYTLFIGVVGPKSGNGMRKEKK